MIFADLALARRLERTEAAGASAYVQARRRMTPHATSAVLEVGGATAAFDTPDSPVTQTFGLGLFEETTPAQLDELEAFFQTAGAPVQHEVSPLAGVGVLQLLSDRGYRPVELTSVMMQPLPASVAGPAAGVIFVRRAVAGEEDLWSETALHGWIGEHPEYREFLLESGRLTAHSVGTSAYFAERDGVPIATGALRCHEGVAMFAGAATVPQARGQGAQQALLAARMGDAVARGCDLAMMCAVPGSASQRNAERHGFRIAYTRVKWMLAVGLR